MPEINWNKVSKSLLESVSELHNAANASNDPFAIQAKIIQAGLLLHLAKAINAGMKGD